MSNALLVLFAMSILVSCQTQEHHDYAKLIPPAPSLSAPAFRQSIHYSDFTVDPLVTNGDCYEQFRITIPDSISVLTLPTGTTSHRRDGTSLEVRLKKTLHWAGHPGDTKTSIDDERSQMGVAMKITGRTLRITSFGAWHSFEGGSSISLLAAVPPGVSIRQAKGQPDNLTAERLTQEGWIVIPSRPALKKDYDSFTKQ